MAKHRSNPKDDLDDDQPRRKQKRRPGGSRLFWFGSRLFVLLLLFGVLAFFAPILVGSTGLWKRLLASAAPEIAKQIDAKSLSLSWISPIEVRGLVVRDPAGQPLAEVTLIKSRKTLLEIALNHRDLGTFDVEEPKAKIVLRANGSNVEDLLAKLPKSEGKSESVGIGLVLTKGTVQLDDQVAGRIWQLENLTVDVSSPRAIDQPKKGTISASLKSLADSAAAGQMAVEFSWQPDPTEKSPVGSGQAQITLQGLPTEVVEGAVRRFASDIRPRGPLTLQAAGAWKDDGTVQVLLNSLATTGISVAAPAMLGTDRPTIVITSGQGALQLAGGRVTVPNLQLASNLVSLGGKASAAVGLADGGDAEISGQINVAEIVKQLPATLHLRPDSKLESGVAQISLASASAADGRRWKGSLKTRDFRGVAAGRAVEFDQPLEIDFAVRQSPAGPVIEQLVGQSNFLRLEGRGSLGDGSLSAKTNLDKLVEELESLIDFGGTSLEGELAADVRWKHSETTGWTATADAQTKNFKATAPGLSPWQEPNLRLTANVQADMTGSSLSQINSGKLGIEAGADRLDAELSGAVKSPSAASVWPVKFTFRGDLASWWPRLGLPRAWETGGAGLAAPAGVPPAEKHELRISGFAEASGSGRFALAEAELGQTTVQVNNLELVKLVKKPYELALHESIAVREPIIKLETSGVWNRAKSTLTLGSTTFASSAVAFRADGVRAELGKQPSVVGTVDLRGDLPKLSSWMPSSLPPNSQIAGGLTGHLDIGYRGQALVATWTADVENLAYLVAPSPQPGAATAFASASNPAAWEPLWREPRVTLAGQGTFDPTAGTLKIERTTLAAASASLGAAGTVSKLTTPSPEIDLSGEIAYDLDVVTREIQLCARQPGRSGAAALPLGLETLQLSGKEKRQFVVKGPLYAATGNLTPARGAVSAGTTSPAGLAISDALVGEASLGWQGAQYVGLVAGPADFRAKLAGGVVNVGPLDIPLAEGRLTTAPRIMLNNGQPAVVVDRGPVLTNVRISPEMCSLWLKYVAPMVADAVNAEGKFSLSLNGANVPLSAPVTANLAGTLAIQSAEVGPGSVGQQLLGMAQQAKSFLGKTGGQADGRTRDLTVLSFPQQEVPFEVSKGVAHHHGLKMMVGDLAIVTEGTVNIQSEEFDLRANVTLPESVFKDKDGLLASLKGQPIVIPIKGSFSRPPDLQNALAGWFQQNAGATARNLIGSQIEKRLQGEGGLLQRGQNILQQGENNLQRELGQGLRGIFGGPPPAQPQPNQPRPQPR